jgi:hypothetical protein
MTFEIPIIRDSHNSYPHDTLRITEMTRCVEIQIGGSDRVITVDPSDLRRVLSALDYESYRRPYSQETPEVPTAPKRECVCGYCGDGSECY